MKPLLLCLSLCAFALTSAGPVPDAQRYWISSTGKTHNSSCIYYGAGHGHFSADGSGNNCKFCGGDGK